MESPKAIDYTLTYSDTDTFGSEIRFLPIRMDGPVGIYAEQTVDLLKELRGQEIDASWSIEKGRRGWYGERSGVIETLIIPLVLGVASSAAWDALKLSFRKKEKANYKIRVFARKEADGSQDRIIEIEGTGTDLAAALEKLDPWRELENGKDSAK